MAYNKHLWALIDHDEASVAEDRADQWYGRRDSQWARFRNIQTAETYFFMNHHGPLPLNSGGECAGEATAYNILRTIAAKTNLLTRTEIESRGSHRCFTPQDEQLQQ